MTSAADSIKQTAASLGFDACAIARADMPIDPDDRLGEWLRRGYHADMLWMARTQSVRQNPGEKLPGVKSVVVVARNYNAPRPDPPPNSGRVAKYAWGRDYHRALRKPLRTLAAHVESLGDSVETYCCIDSGPVLEKAWAARAGLGWLGKNGLILRRDLGSYFFLAVILTTLDVPADPPMADFCGSCKACIDACPTQAVVAPQVVDSNRCISYHTIENRGEVPQDVADRTDNWVFGCDICQEVCPWNRKAPITNEQDFHPRPGHANPQLDQAGALDEAAFRTEYLGAPILRAKFTGFLRNLRIALRNISRR